MERKKTSFLPLSLISLSPSLSLFHDALLKRVHVVSTMASVLQRRLIVMMSFVRPFLSNAASAVSLCCLSLFFCHLETGHRQ